MIGAIVGGPRHRPSLRPLGPTLRDGRIGPRRGPPHSVLGIRSPSLAWILVGAFLMQFMVQGAWGVIPAHINELSPDRLRGFFPGFAYQVKECYSQRPALLTSKRA